MSKLHRDNAGYVGCSYEDTQDPYYSYNKLSLSLSENDKSVTSEEQTFTVTAAGGAYYINGVSRQLLTLSEGGSYTFDLSDSSAATHPFRIKSAAGAPTDLTIFNGTAGNYLSSTPSASDFWSGNVNRANAHLRQNGHGWTWTTGIPVHPSDLVQVWAEYFNNTSNHSIDFQITKDGTSTWVTADAQANITINAGRAFVGGTGFDGLWTGVRCRGGSDVSVTGILGCFVNKAWVRSSADVALTTSGTQGQSGAYAKFVAPFDYQRSYFGYEYYCNSHSNMGASIALIPDSVFNGARPILKSSDKFGQTVSSGYNGDEHAANLYLALPLKDNANDVSASINPNSNTKTASVSSVSSSNSQSKFYGSSHQWNANTDGITYAEQGSELVFGTGDYTIECWFYNDNSHSGGGSGRCYLFDTRLGGSQTGDPPQVTATVDGDTTINFQNLSTSFNTLNKWVHFAGVRKSGYIYLYINGKLHTFGAETTNHTTNGIAIGRATDGGYGWAGYIQDFRVYKSAKYTGDFELPEQIDAFDRSPTINNNHASEQTGTTWQTSVNKFYGGAAGFLGGSNSSHLVIPSSSDFVLDGDFTIETWIYVDGSYTNNYRGVIQGSTQETGGLSGVFHCSIYNQTINFGVHASSGNASLNYVTSNTWHHIAIVRSGSTLSFWVDGSPAGSATDSRTFTNNGLDIMIGQICDGSSTKQPLNGYLQDFRLYKGFAKYTSSFSPPERSVKGTARRYPSGVYVVS